MSERGVYFDSSRNSLTGVGVSLGETLGAWSAKSYTVVKPAETLSFGGLMDFLRTRDVTGGEQPEQPIQSVPGAMRGDKSLLISRNGVEA